MIKRLFVLAISLAVASFDVLRAKLRLLLARPEPTAAVVLYYHAITAPQRKRFARQMDFLVAVAQPFSAVAPIVPVQNGRRVAVTFDDGFRSVVDNAVPELVQRNIPFTMFVPSGSLGTRPMWVQDTGHPSWNERVLTGEELRSLAALALASIGSHSITHPNLLRIDSANAHRELRQSREDLESVIGMSVDTFSFPHGAFSTALLELACQAGYRRVFTIEPMPIAAESSPFTVGRVAVDPDDWFLEFRLKMAGAYRWRSYLHDLTHRQRRVLRAH